MSKKQNHWYPRYIGDYIKKTAELSIIEHGAYTLLLDHYYATEKPLDANASVLHRVCRAFDDAERNAIDRVLQKFFVLMDDGYHNTRADAELAKRIDISGKRRDAAQKKHAKNNSHKYDANAGANAYTPTPTPTPTPTYKDIYTGSLDGFPEFWRHYPKQRAGSKDKALSAYLKAIKRHSAEAVLTGCMAYAASDEVAKGFAKGCAAWLNDERYLNDYSHKKGDSKNDKQSNTIRSIKALGFGNEPQRENNQDIPNQLLLSPQRIRQDT